MRNETLMKRICLLIAMTKAESEEVIWDMYLTTGSIDEVLANLEE